MKNPPLDLKCLRAVALAVTDEARAKAFYGETLRLQPAIENNITWGYQLGETILLLKPIDQWYGRPAAELNARITLEVEDALGTERALREAGVVISDPIQIYDGHPVGAFLDSEGNKIWFCSNQ